MEAPEIGMIEKPTNPKDLAAFDRLPLHLVPPSLEVFAAMAFAEGAAKYGRYNWRAMGVSASVYYAAVQRHLKKWFNGEEADPVTGVPHLASALACLGIIVDAQMCVRFRDDRPPAVGLTGVMDDCAAGAQRVAALYRDRDPHQWTINDTLPE